jgi:hypothetical protein
MAISLPHKARRSAGESFSKFTPLNRILLPAAMLAGVGGKQAHHGQ